MHIYRLTAQAFSELHNYLKGNDYAGYEFDDLLDSPIVRVLAMGNAFLQRVAIQIGRRCILNLRPLLRVRRQKSTKAFGFFAKGYLYYYMATGRAEFLGAAESILSWLDANYCTEYAGRSWGNAFDFASRGGLITKGTPTIVWTAHIAEAFDLAHDVTKDDRYRDVVNAVALFITEHIGRLVDDSGVCLGYVPGAAAAPIHNSNLLGAVALIRSWKHTKDQAKLLLAKKAIDWSCSRMNADGSWYYGESKKYRWIDNFHTAYNLDSLLAAQDMAGSDIVDSRTIERAYHYWVGHFFASDGRPKYYHDRLLPVDIQCAAQAIETLSKYSRRERTAIELAGRVAKWTIEHMQKRNGAFVLRKGRLFVNPLESIHWGQSTMLAALGCLLLHLGSPSQVGGRANTHEAGSFLVSRAASSRPIHSLPFVW